MFHEHSLIFSVDNYTTNQELRIKGNCSCDITFFQNFKCLFIIIVYVLFSDFIHPISSLVNLEQSSAPKFEFPKSIFSSVPLK